MMGNKINFIALAAGISSLILVAISFFVPWWKLTFGSPANVQVNFSPVNLNFAHSGAAVNIPLIWALNVACLLTLLAGGIILSIYAIKPTKPYSKHLLGFGYKKPLYTLIAFIAILIAVPILLQAFAGFSLPINGTAIVTPKGSNGSASVTTVLEWPFYFAIVVTALSVAARVAHMRVAKQPPLPAP
jgi:hypothetical protein